MLNCTLDLSQRNEFSKLKCPGIGEFDVFSGDDRFRNKIECAHIPKATIPPRTYWIVDRPTGDIKTKTLTFLQDIYSGNNHDIWFALYRIDEQIDDYTVYNRVNRCNFRLHPSRLGGYFLGMHYI